MSVFEDLQHLVTTFHRDIERARQLEPSNANDDLALKMAVVGFSYNSPATDWGKNHADFVTLRLAQDYSDEELVEYGENSGNVRLFYALCVGFLLGLYQQNKMNDQEFDTAEWQIPGLIMLHLSTLTSGLG
jgi:hypothetical protein